MKKMGDMLLTREPFSEIVMGNTALVRAMVEAGTRVVTSYPGSPTPEIATAIGSIPEAVRPFYFEFSTNEKVATEVAYGAALNGHLSTVFFKSVGLNVASDTFVQLNHMNIIGGMVVILGDDPGANSSQNEQDNRHIAQLSYTPVLEPASPQEAYQFYLAAAHLARDKKMAIILRLTTHVCHAKERVCFAGWTPTPTDDTPRFDPANGPYIPIATPLVLPMKAIALRRRDEVAAWAEISNLNTLLDNGNRKKGILTMGLPYLSVREVLKEAAETPDILKLGIVYPLPAKLILDFLRAHEQVKIVEELDDVVEKEVKLMAYNAGLSTRIVGKLDRDDWIGEYGPDKVYEVLYKSWPGFLPKRLELEDAQAPPSPARPPQLCPGCGHRAAFHPIKHALSDRDITVGDIGCHLLGYLPPYRMGQLIMCMGASTGMGSGLSIFNKTRKVVAFMGDSTFFHAGVPGLVNALFNNHNLTLILMENGTTAMTGHQDTPASGHNFNGTTMAIPIRKVIEGLGVERIWETDTYDQKKLAEYVKEAVREDGVKVIIAKHPCMLKFTRESRRKPSYKPRKLTIDQSKCDRLHVCVSDFGCPTFQLDEDGSVHVNWDLCIGDGSCMVTCPVGAITTPRIVED